MLTLRHDRIAGRAQSADVEALVRSQPNNEMKFDSNRGLTRGFEGEPLALYLIRTVFPLPNDYTKQCTR